MPTISWFFPHHICSLHLLHRSFSVSEGEIKSSPNVTQKNWDDTIIISTISGLRELDNKFESLSRRLPKNHPHQLQEGSNAVEQDAAVEGSDGGDDGWKTRRNRGTGGLALGCKNHQGICAVADHCLVLPSD